MKPGFYDNLNINDYHADPAFSNSWFRHLAKNPRTLKFSRQTIQPDKAAFDLGKAGHAAILERETYYQNVAVAPDRVLSKSGSRNTNAYREWAEEQKAAGKTILTQDQAAQVRGMYQSVYEHPDHEQARSILLLKDNLIEQSIFFEEPNHGFMCKVRPDIRNPRYRFLADLKTCRDASRAAFSKDAANLGYHRQAAFYLAGINAIQDAYYQTFLFICVETEPPHCVAVYRCDDEMLDKGRRAIGSLLELYAECLEAGEYPGFPDTIQDLSLPRWAV